MEKVLKFLIFMALAGIVIIFIHVAMPEKLRWLDNDNLIGTAVFTLTNFTIISSLLSALSVKI
jgi:hypothetical protein